MGESCREEQDDRAAVSRYVTKSTQVSVGTLTCCELSFAELLARNIPLAKSADGGIEVKVIAGRCFGVESGVFTQTPTIFWDVRMLGAGTFEECVPEHYNAFVYVLDGDVVSGKKGHEGRHGSCFVYGDGEGVRVSSKGKARFVVLAGEPLNERVVQHGPFVMNSNEQILKAFRDYQDGKF